MDELIQYIVVNSDLIKEYNMSVGKIGAQCAHVSRVIALRDQHDPIYKRWYSDCMKTIVLRGNEKQLLKLVEAGFTPIYDLGLTEIKANSLTVAGLPVMTKEQAKPFIKRLQLL